MRSRPLRTSVRPHSRALGLGTVFAGLLFTSAAVGNPEMSVMRGGQIHPFPAFATQTGDVPHQVAPVESDRETNLAVQASSSTASRGDGVPHQVAPVESEQERLAR